MNSVLATKTRPTVMFDVTNSQHRYWAYEFMQNRSWKDCPVIFALPQGEPSVATMVAREMLMHYAAQEFGNQVPAAGGVVKMPRKGTVSG